MSWIDDRVSNAKKQVEITATPKMEEEVETNTWPAWQECGKGGGGGGEGEWGQIKDSQISPLLLCRFSITWKSLIKLGKVELTTASLMPRNKWKLRLRRKWRKKWKQTRGLHDKSAERGGGVAAKGSGVK